MKFGGLIEHLGKRGFATRKSWYGRVFVFFGMDNVFYEVFKVDDDYREKYYIMCLADIKAGDWEIVDLYWNRSKDRALPFLKKDADKGTVNESTQS